MSETGFSGLKLRCLSGLVLAPLALFALYYGGWPFLILVALAATLSFIEWHSMAAKGGRFGRDIALGAMYLGLCFLSFIFLRAGMENGAYLAIALLVGVWASDTGAYFCGKFIGGPKMVPRLSPNKTMAGLGGAMVFFGLALALAVALAPRFGIPQGAGALGNPAAAFAAGALLGVVGQAGDVFISAFKRRVGLKDTGSLIPGHGGILDRIDSLLLVSPAFLLLVWIALP